jgi:ribosomal protein S7
VGNSSKRDTKRVVMAEKRRRALQLRIGGATFEQIATQIGYPGQRHRAYKIVNEAIREIYREPAEELVQIECARLDAMLLGLWTRARSGEERAIASVIKIMDRRAAYLGLDAATKQEHTGTVNVTSGPGILIPPESDE